MVLYQNPKVIHQDSYIQHVHFFVHILYFMYHIVHNARCLPSKAFGIFRQHRSLWKTATLPEVPSTRLPHICSSLRSLWSPSKASAKLPARPRSKVYMKKKVDPVYCPSHGFSGKWLLPKNNGHLHFHVEAGKKSKPSPTPNSVPKPTRFNPTNRSPAEAKVSSVIPVSSVQKGVKGVLRGSYRRKRFPQGQNGFQPFEITNGWLLTF